MEEDRVAEFLFTEDEYEQFNGIYDEFCNLMDYKGELNSNHFYNQKKVFRKILESWPLIKKLCTECDLELKVSPDEFNNIIFGFNRKAIAELYTSDRYQGIAVDKILGLEEERLKKDSLSLFHDIKLNISKFIDNATRTKKTQFHQDDFTELDYTIPIKDEELTNEQAVELLGGGMSASTISKWVKAGLLRDNCRDGHQHRVFKSSVLLLKHQRDEQKKLKKAIDNMNVEASKRE